VEGAAEMGSDPDVSLHLYGKSHCFPGRKMGHVTVVADSVNVALKKLDYIRPQIQVKGAHPID
jgi:5-(carboxyamino)imidazole ribonucleotide synthase